MQRDMNLIRQIVFVIEASPGEIDSETIKIDGFSREQIGYHCELMHEAGLFKGIDTFHLESSCPEFHIQRLTSKGHDFADASRDNGMWKRAMTVVAEKVGGTAIDTLIQYLKAQAVERLGLSGESAP